MTSFFSDPRGEKPQSARPPIWVRGLSKPVGPSDLRGFARASLQETRNWGAPVVSRGAARLIRLGVRIESGDLRVDPVRLGRMARLVPSGVRVGGGMRGLGRLLDEAARFMLPPPPEPLVIRPWAGAPGAIATRASAAPPPAVAPDVQEVAVQVAAVPPAAPRPAPAPAATARDAAPSPPILLSDEDQGTLDAIRNLMRAETRPQRPRRATALPDHTAPAAAAPPRGAHSLPPLEPPQPTPPGLLLRLSAQALGAALLAVMLPAGAARTAIATLRRNPERRV